MSDILYQKIKDLCTNNQITITELERLLGFGNGTIHRWSKASPTIDKIKLVADYFGVSIDSFFIDASEMPTKDGAEIAKAFDTLSPSQKDLIKCYISIVSNNHVVNC